MKQSSASPKLASSLVWRLLFGSWQPGAKPTTPAPPVDGVQQRQGREEFRRALLNHLPGLVTFAVASYVLFRVAAISGGSTATALAVLSSASPLEVLGGSLLVGLPMLVYGLFNWVFIVRPVRNGHIRPNSLAALMFFAAVFLSATVPWIVGSIAWAFWFAIVYGNWRSLYRVNPPVSSFDLSQFLRRPPTDIELRRIWVKMNRYHREFVASGGTEQELEDDREFKALGAAYNDRHAAVFQDEARTRVLAAALAAVAVAGPMVIFPLREPWVPLEAIRTQAGAPAIGYVLADEGGWTTVLTEPERIILRLRSVDVVDRQVCLLSQGRADRRRPLTRVFSSDGQQYEVCSRLVKSTN